VKNVYTGNYAYGGRGAFYNEKTGAAGAGRKVTWGNEDTGKQGTAGKATVYNPQTGKTTHISGAKGEDAGFIKVNDQVIVGKDGNYYRPDGQGGWEQITRPPTGSKPANGAGAQQRQEFQSQRSQAQITGANQQNVQQLNNELNARQMGAQRQQSYQMNRPAFSGRAAGGRRR
jgi:hypothetical protein